MALTTTEEALVRRLLDQQAAILSLAGNEATITSKLGATKVTLSDLAAASSLADADLLLTRQGTTDKSVRADILAAYMAAELNLSALAPKASPALTGTPTAPTATPGTGNTQIATTAFVQAAQSAGLGSTSPLMDGTAAAGTATKSAREDHRHPTDTTRAPLVSPSFTGAPTAPTATPGTGNTQIATTAFAKAEAASAAAAVAVSFASSAENAAGTVEGKAVDPLGIREAFNATGSAPVFACRAWVNFNGTGTVAIRASGNVSSITDNSVGDYIVNFTTAMPDVNYCVNVSTERGGGSGFVNVASYGNSSVRITTYNSGALTDVTSAFVSIFR